MRAITEREKRLRVLNPELALIQPDVSWQAAYMEQIDQGWHDYQHDVEHLRDPDAFSVFVGRINSGQSWKGSQECHVRWFINPTTRKILGRVRLKNIQVPASDPIWQDPTTRAGGHVGYSICPSSRGLGLSTLMLSLALDECFLMGLADCFWWINVGTRRPRSVGGVAR